MHVLAKDFDIQAFFQASAIKPKKLGTNSGVAVYDDGTINYSDEVGCHAYMRGFVTQGLPNYYGSSNKKLVAIYTSLWSHTYDDTDLEYFRFICNEKYSPWRGHIKGREVLWGKQGDKDIPIAVKLTDMNASTQAVFNFLLATRMHYAQPGMAKAYKAFRENGFTRTESVFLSASIGLSPKDVFHWPYIGDFPYDTAFANMDWKKWAEGKPRCRKDGKLSNSATINPCNGIWNRGTNSSGIVIAQGHSLKNNIIQNLISEEKEVKNVFGQMTKKRFALPLADAISKLKANKEDWKCPDSTSQAEELIEATPQPSTDSWSSVATQSYVNHMINLMQPSSTATSSVQPQYYTVSVPLESSPGSIY